MKNYDSLIGSLIDEYYATLERKESEATEKQLRLAELEKSVIQFQAETEVIRAYYTNHHAEERRMFNRANALLNLAIERSNPEIAKMAIELIHIIRKKSLF